MRSISGLAALLTLLAATAVAQPIIIPLEPQPKPVAPPIASAPPVAPPVAAPTQPETAIVRGEPQPGSGATQEEAYQPKEK